MNFRNNLIGWLCAPVFILAAATCWASVSSVNCQLKSGGFSYKVPETLLDAKGDAKLTNYFSNAPQPGYPNLEVNYTVKNGKLQSLSYNVAGSEVGAFITSAPNYGGDGRDLSRVQIASRVVDGKPGIFLQCWIQTNPAK